MAISASALAVGLRLAAGQEAEVARPGFAQPAAREAEVPRSAPPQPTVPTSPTTAVTAPAVAPTIAQPPIVKPVDRELLSAKACCLTCHGNDQFGKMLMLPMMTDDMLVKMNYITSGPAHLAEPRLPDYRQRIILDKDKFYQSAHARLECIDCHDTITTKTHPQYIPNVRCDRCHGWEQRLWEQGAHGQAFAKGEPHVPNCDRCHGNYHEMVPSSKTLSPIYRLNIHKTCASCHASSEVLAGHPDLKQDAVATYQVTIHGEGTCRSGIPGSATCSDCHGSHRNLDHSDVASSTSARNTIVTCGACHVNDATSFSASVHGLALFAESSTTTPPGCSSCHLGHGEIRVNTAEFKLGVVALCGSCHLFEYDTYLETYHGKVTMHGGLQTARCYDCHDYHGAQCVTSPTATVSPIDPTSGTRSARTVGTCKSCHSYSNEKWVQFIPHLKNNDKTHPQTYYSWLFMTVLLVGTMGFFVVHTLLWLVRELADRPQRKARRTAEGHFASYRIQRFNLVHRLSHAILFVSVIGLAVTGLPLRYSTTLWGRWVFDLFGGHMGPRVLHRIFAALTILYVGIHFVYLWNLWRRAPKQPWLKIIFGPSSMIPNWTDVKQFFQHVQWFLFLGPSPRFGRWTYYEKFDYWAVFWGVAIIGVSGLIMALTPISARFLPGWIFNVALIIHSDEALLAASFLFAIHFFHIHLRPEKFPMDHVMFSGGLTPQEMADDRPLEMEQLQAEGRLDGLRTGTPSPVQLSINRVIAAVTLLIGLALLAGMFWTEIVSRFFR